MATINHKPLDELDTQIVLLLAKNNLRATETAYDIHMRRSAVIYRIGKIKTLTGLDPLNFYDLCELVRRAKKNGGLKHG